MRSGTTYELVLHDLHNACTALLPPDAIINYPSSKLPLDELTGYVLQIHDATPLYLPNSNVVFIRNVTILYPLPLTSPQPLISQDKSVNDLSRSILKSLGYSSYSIDLPLEDAGFWLPNDNQIKDLQNCLLVYHDDQLSSLPSLLSDLIHPETSSAHSSFIVNSLSTLGDSDNDLDLESTPMEYVKPRTVGKDGDQKRMRTC
ncbi:hypothetical protein GEMRC1_002743 [Eukaryota sp. GEM-RC1]